MTKVALRGLLSRKLRSVLTGFAVVIGVAFVVGGDGGQLSGGRTPGLGYVHEACTHLWGRGGTRQVAPHHASVVASGGGPLAGSLLLVTD